MRVKTDERRAAIIEIADAVFLERGFEAASMSEVAARLGGSKQTLYGYFRSKAELFAAVMIDKRAAQVLEMFDVLDSSADLESLLMTLGDGLLGFLLQDEALAVQRAVIAESARSDVGRTFYESGPKQALVRLSRDFAARMARGELRQADPWRAATHFTALLESGLHQQRLFGAIGAVADADRRAAVKAAVEVFLRAYR